MKRTIFFLRVARFFARLSKDTAVAWIIDYTIEDYKKGRWPGNKVEDKYKHLV